MTDMQKERQELKENLNVLNDSEYLMFKSLIQMTAALMISVQQSNSEKPKETKTA